MYRERWIWETDEHSDDGNEKGDLHQTVEDEEETSDHGDSGMPDRPCWKREVATGKYNQR